ncbi:MAG: hypothetical protein B7C24_01795 [Bacteroidetes bacterium 4572_77]|nr:MAG: hypothetical protein B7C24_01795 [Bacteroidetes bacterium 4572_77]
MLLFENTKKFLPDKVFTLKNGIFSVAFQIIIIIIIVRYNFVFALQSTTNKNISILLIPSYIFKCF